MLMMTDKVKNSHIVRYESIRSNVADESLSVRLCADQHGLIAHAHVCVCRARTTGNLCFVACAPSAWGLREARARQLEAQSVEGVHYSVVGGRPDPRRHPNHLPLALPSDQDVVPDSSALPNPLDTYGGREGGKEGGREERIWRDAGGEEALAAGRTERREHS